MMYVKHKLLEYLQESIVQGKLECPRFWEVMVITVFPLKAEPTRQIMCMLIFVCMMCWVWIFFLLPNVIFNGSSYYSHRQIQSWGTTCRGCMTMEGGGRSWGCIETGRTWGGDNERGSLQWVLVRFQALWLVTKKFLHLYLHNLPNRHSTGVCTFRGCQF